MIISERIFAMLEEKGMSQKTFSGLTGIAQSTISDWKRKKTNPAADKIMIICEVLEVTPYELLSGTESANFNMPDYVMVKRDSEEYILLEQYEKMPGWDRRKLMGYVEKMNK